MLKRCHNPDPVPLRRNEYQSMDGELLHALVETVEALGQQGIALPDSMVAVLQRRQEVKNRFKK